MPEAALLPTNRDEDWRYSDVAALQDHAPETFEAWEDVRVAEGESWSDLIVIDGADGLQMRRLRIALEKGARAELAALVAGRLDAHVPLLSGGPCQRRARHDAGLGALAVRALPLGRHPSARAPHRSSTP